jgi:type II secretory pathway pseudopilin PulG
MQIPIKKLDPRGDTIVEVLIVLAILSTAFVLSYSTANKALVKARNSQEHTAALGVLNAQVELVRNAYANQTSGLPASAGQFFCMASPDTVKLLPAVPTDPTTDNLTAYPAECLKGNLYSVSIAFDPMLSSYTFRSRWAGYGTLGVQQEELSYRIYQLTTVGSGGFSGPATPVGGGGGGGGGGGSFSWVHSGAPWVSCAKIENIGDGLDGCFAAGTSMFSYRNIDVAYDLTGTPMTTGSASLVVSYNQAASGGSTPPSGYSFQLDVRIDGIYVGTMNLPIENASTSWTARNSATLPVSIPANNPGQISFQWTNNAGVDPNLQINSISLSRP